MRVPSRGPASASNPVKPNRFTTDRFVHFAMLGLAACGFFAFVGTGRLDTATIAFTSAVLFLRALAALFHKRVPIPPRAVSFLAVGCVLFYPAEILLLNTDFFLATVHSVCFLAGLKLLTAESNRDYISVGAVAFVELVAGAVLSFQATFFLWLALFSFFATAALAGAEIRRGTARNGRTVLEAGAGLGWRLGITTGFGAFGILAMAGGLFLIVPRTARVAARLLPYSGRLTGFSNVVDLGTFGRIARDNSPVMYVQSYSRPLPGGLKWRGAALTRFDGRRWSAPPLTLTEVPAPNGTAEVADIAQRSRRDGRRLLYRVDLSSTTTGTLFIAGIPEYINTTAPRVLRTPEDAFRVPFAGGRELRYEVSALSAMPLPVPLTVVERLRCLRLPAVNSRIWDLARAWVGNEAGSDWERAHRIEAHFRNDYRYSLETAATPVRDPLVNFLFNAKAGHCEYFASAMAVMLRTVGIPSRVATGYLGGYYNELSGLQVVRASDAHAWVEGWIEGRGWVTFDPTPSAPAAPELMTQVGVYFDALDSFWQRWVMAYDLSSQATLASKVATATRGWRMPSRPSPGAWWAGFKADSLELAGIALVAALAWMWLPGIWRSVRARLRVRKAVRSARSDVAASLLYETVLESLERRGFTKQPGMTPLEFILTLPEGDREALEPITARYNEARYGAVDGAATELARLVVNFRTTGPSSR